MESIETENAKPVRGGWLTTFLVLMIALNMLTAIAYIFMPVAIQSAFPRLTMFLIYLMTGLALLNVLWSLMLWNWRRWGLYGFILTALVALLINMYAGIPLLNALCGLVGPIIVGLLVRRKWSWFV